MRDQSSIRSTRSPIINSYYSRARLKLSYATYNSIYTHALLLQRIGYLKFTHCLHLHVSSTGLILIVPSSVPSNLCFLTFIVQTPDRNPFLIFARTNSADSLLDHVHHRQVAFCLITIRGCVLKRNLVVKRGTMVARVWHRVIIREDNVV